MKYVIYQGNDETIIGALKKENKILEEFFHEGSRDVDDYDRRLIDDCAIMVTSTIRAR